MFIDVILVLSLVTLLQMFAMFCCFIAGFERFFVRLSSCAEAWIIDVNSVVSRYTLPIFFLAVINIL